jgi:hypothetical protein
LFTYPVCVPDKTIEFPWQTLVSAPADTPAELLILTPNELLELFPQAFCAETVTEEFPVTEAVVTLTVIEFVPAPEVIVHPDGTVQL